MVEKVVLNRDAETAVVYYAVADYSGNVAKQSRVFPADIADIEKDGEDEELFEDELFPNLGLYDGAEVSSSAEGSSIEAEAEIE